LAAQKAAGPSALWNVPYMPIDPADVGRSYDSVIRVNSQSGKGGVAYLMEAEFGVVMPRRLQVEFSGEVQTYTDTYGGEMTAQNIWDLFECTYLEPTTASLRYVEHQLFDHATPGSKARVQGIRIGVEVNGQPMLLTGEGNGPIDAAVHALKGAGIEVQVRSYEERSTRASTNGGDAQACAFLELVSASGGTERFGVGMDTNIVTASVKALLSGVHRLGVADTAVLEYEAA
jgi:2-isopropylmalate synthase